MMIRRWHNGIGTVAPKNWIKDDGLLRGLCCITIVWWWRFSARSGICIHSAQQLKDISLSKIKYLYNLDLIEQNNAVCLKRLALKYKSSKPLKHSLIQTTLSSNEPLFNQHFICRPRISYTCALCRHLSSILCALLGWWNTYSQNADNAAQHKTRYMPDGTRLGAMRSQRSEHDPQ